MEQKASWLLKVESLHKQRISIICCHFNALNFGKVLVRERILCNALEVLLKNPLCSSSVKRVMSRSNIQKRHPKAPHLGQRVAAGLSDCPVQENSQANVLQLWPFP